MDKQFLNALLSKPDPYLKVWVFVYCNLDDKQSFSMPTSYMLSMFKVSRTTLQRIVHFGCDWKANGNKLESVWSNNLLTINVYFAKDVSQLPNQKTIEVQTIEQPKQIEQVLEFEDVIEEQPKNKRKKTESDKLYPQMIEAYDTFCKTRIGMGAKINAHQGKSMKSIMEYLTNQVQAKHQDEVISEEAIKENVLVAWQYILNNWSNITGYYAEQIKLNQIDSNLPNLLMQLKNNKNKKPNVRDEKFVTNYNQVGQVNFD